MKKYECLYDFLKKEGYSRAKIKKITSAYFNGKEKELPVYMQKSICYWIATERYKGHYEANHHKN